MSRNIFIVGRSRTRKQAELHNFYLKQIAVICGR